MELSARVHSDRGLHLRDVVFDIFKSEYGQPEFAMQVEKDSKGMTDLPDKTLVSRLVRLGVEGADLVAEVNTRCTKGVLRGLSFFFEKKPHPDAPPHLP